MTELSGPLGDCTLTMRLFSLYGQKLTALVVILIWLWRLIVNMKEISGTFEAALVMAPSIIVKRTEFG